MFVIQCAINNYNSASRSWWKICDSCGSRCERTCVYDRVCVCVCVIFTTFYCHRAGARVRNEDGFYSVKVEWLARRRWHMATKITTVSRHQLHTHTHTWAAMWMLFRRGWQLFALSLRRIMIARLLFFVLCISTRKKLFASLSARSRQLKCDGSPCRTFHFWRW